MNQPNTALGYCVLKNGHPQKQDDTGILRDAIHPLKRSMRATTFPDLRAVRAAIKRTVKAEGPDVEWPDVWLVFQPEA